jgi:hypothetical protein
LRNRPLSPAISAAVIAALLITVPGRTSAHDIPSTVTVLAFIKPEGQRLHLVVRVPLAAMRDVNFPERAKGYLDIAASDSLVRDAARQWIASYLEVHEGADLLENPTLVAARISLPSDRSFEQYQTALANVTAPGLPGSTEIVWQQAMLDVLFDYAIKSDRSRFAIHPALAHLGLRTTTVLRFLPAGGSERAFEYLGDPGLIQLDPRWFQAAWAFVQLGFRHILDGIDHLLFIFCLVIPVRRLRPLIAIVTSFTVAHSITLIASATGFAPSALWFPALIETLIALSIVYMALENIVGARLERRWIIAFGFGLVHGFGFSFILRQSLQFAGTHLATSLVSFNLGVELGQIFVLLVVTPALALLYRFVVAQRMGVIILSALVAHTAWHWMVDRFTTLRQYQFQWPALDVAFLTASLRALTLLVILGAAVWALYSVFGKVLRAAPERESNA